MAPDLNTIGADGRWDYSTPGSGGYSVPDIVYDVRRDISSQGIYLTIVGSIFEEAQSIDNRSWLVRYTDGIPDPEELRERGARHIREKR
jgi:hypothetical protein